MKKYSRTPDILERPNDDVDDRPIIYHIGRNDEDIDPEELIIRNTITSDILKTEDERTSNSLREKTNINIRFRNKKIRPTYKNYKQEPTSRIVPDTFKVEISGAEQKYDVHKTVKFRSKKSKKVKAVQRSTQDLYQIDVQGPKVSTKSDTQINPHVVKKITDRNTTINVNNKNQINHRDMKFVSESSQNGTEHDVNINVDNKNQINHRDMKLVAQSSQNGTEHDVNINVNDSDFVERKTVKNMSHAKTRLHDGKDLSIQREKIGNLKTTRLNTQSPNHSFNIQRTFFNTYGPKIAKQSRAEIMEKISDFNRTKGRDVIENDIQVDINQKVQNTRPKKKVSQKKQKLRPQVAEFDINDRTRQIGKTHNKKSRESMMSTNKNQRVIEMQNEIEPSVKSRGEYRKKKSNSHADTPHTKDTKDRTQIEVKQRKEERLRKLKSDMKARNPDAEVVIEVQSEKPRSKKKIRKPRDVVKETGSNITIEVQENKNVNQKKVQVPVASNLGSEDTKDLKGPKLETNRKIKVETQKFPLEKFQEKNLDFEKQHLIFN
mgnify:CR=1 FL=1|tara:strand:- start:7688 stop:9328 length:1641 start_codon:yes stop_codon:yes gene_type:complete